MVSDAKNFLIWTDGRCSEIYVVYCNASADTSENTCKDPRRADKACGGLL
ncbi:hypothetical protein CUS_6266 [Ruminococcus albus 8]|uniref:Uncharacterized protein n=1 Tax=Ruminococcus albus 8 TaxID=246199 RepID=E9S9F3_RUMAL|nr:hypothetical protein CUS_6266 [Ruminococcus albus 8]